MPIEVRADAAFRLLLERGAVKPLHVRARREGARRGVDVRDVEAAQHVVFLHARLAAGRLVGEAVLGDVSDEHAAAADGVRLQPEHLHHGVVDGAPVNAVNR